MAFAELFKATGNEIYKNIAVQTFYSIEQRQENPKGKWSKSAGGRQLNNFALPMILCNLALIL
jgi:N-acylglucosamine 2-epimerase